MNELEDPSSIKYPAVLVYSKDKCYPCKKVNALVNEVESEFSNVNFYNISKGSKHSDDTFGYPYLIFIDCKGRETKRIAGCPMPEIRLNIARISKKKPNIFIATKNFLSFLFDLFIEQIKGNESRATKSDQDKRWGFCEGCEYKIDNQCYDCRCHLPSKIKYKVSKCTQNKWPSLYLDNAPEQ